MARGGRDEFFRRRDRDAERAGCRRPRDDGEQDAGAAFASTTILDWVNARWRCRAKVAWEFVVPKANFGGMPRFKRTGSVINPPPPRWNNETSGEAPRWRKKNGKRPDRVRGKGRRSSCSRGNNRFAARGVKRYLCMRESAGLTGEKIVRELGRPRRRPSVNAHETASSSQKSEWQICPYPLSCPRRRGVLSSEHDWRSGLSGFKRAEYRKGSEFARVSLLITRLTRFNFL